MKKLSKKIAALRPKQRWRRSLGDDDRWQLLSSQYWQLCSRDAFHLWYTGRTFRNHRLDRTIPSAALKEVVYNGGFPRYRLASAGCCAALTNTPAG